MSCPEDEVKVEAEVKIEVDVAEDPDPPRWTRDQWSALGGGHDAFQVQNASVSVSANSEIEEVVKKKINNMRTIYTRCLAKIKRSKRRGAAADEIYKPKWKWFGMLDAFLNPHVTIRREISSMDTDVAHSQPEARGMAPDTDRQLLQVRPHQPHQEGVSYPFSSATEARETFSDSEGEGDEGVRTTLTERCRTEFPFQSEPCSPPTAEDVEPRPSTSQSQLLEGLEEMSSVHPSSPLPPIPTTPASRKRKQPQPESDVAQAVSDLVVLRMRKEARKEARREARAERKRREQDADVDIFVELMKVKLHNLPQEKRRPATLKLLQVLNEAEK